MNLAQLRARLKELTGELDALLQKQVKDDEKAAHLAAITAKTKQMDDLENEITIVAAAEAARARAALPANDPVTVPGVVAKPKDAAEKIGLLIAAMVTAMAEEGTKGLRPTLRILESRGHGELARTFERAQVRTMNSTSASAGGVLLPEDMSMDIIDILRPNATFLQGNPVIIPMPRGTYKMPAAATGATAAYRGETGRIGVSVPTFKSINMSAKLLGGIVPISNQLIRWSGPDVGAWARNDLSAAMGLKLDYSAYFGDGTADTPLGIFNIPGVYSVAASGGTTPTYTQTDTDARKLLNAMENASLPLIRVEWRMAPRVFNYLADLRDGNGNAIYPSLQGTSPTWKGYVVRRTTNFPINGGGTTDESYLALIAFGHLVFGDAMSLQLAISDTATIVNGAQTINAFQDGVTIIRAEMEHDIDTRYVEAIAVLTGVRWGA